MYMYNMVQSAPHVQEGAICICIQWQRVLRMYRRVPYIYVSNGTECSACIGGCHIFIYIYVSYGAKCSACIGGCHMYMYPMVQSAPHVQEGAICICILWYKVLRMYRRMPYVYLSYGPECSASIGGCHIYIYHMVQSTPHVSRRAPPDEDGYQVITSLASQGNSIPLRVINE